jgi:hypothetical protein
VLAQPVAAASSRAAAPTPIRFAYFFIVLSFEVENTPLARAASRSWIT